MIGTWVGAILLFITGLVSAMAIMSNAKIAKKNYRIIGATVVFLACCGISGMLLFSLYGTESGQRQIKDFKSNLGGGIERVVKVYDMEGDLIASYQGRFDVDYDSSRIIFDDENGKRHIIYYSTGTVIIDEI